MRIAVLQPAARQQRPGLDQPVHDRAVGRAELAGLLALGFQHLQPSEQGHVIVIGPIRVDHFGDLAMTVREPDLVVLGPVAGRGVHEARAGVLGDVVAGQQRDGEAVAAVEPRQGVLADHALAVDVFQPPPGGDLGGLADVLGQPVGDDEALVRLGPGLEGEPLLHGLDHIDPVIDVRIIGHGPVAGDGPGRRGPDHHAGAAGGVRAFHHRELHPDRGADMVVVLDLGVGQGGALHRAPHHRLGAAEQLARHQELVELADDRRLGGEIHGGVWRAPASQHAQALELGLLLLDPLAGEGAALGAEFRQRDLVLALAPAAVLLLDLPLDRQAMAVPARRVVDVEAQQEPAPDHEILEDLVERVADVDGAVGVGRPVMQHEQRRAGGLASGADGGEEVVLVPALQDLGLELGQARAHGERGLGQEDGVAVVAAFAGICRGLGVVGHGGFPAQIRQG